MYVHHEHALHMKTRSVCSISWNGCNRWLSVAMWVLEIEPKSFAKAICVVNLGIISVALGTNWPFQPGLFPLGESNVFKVHPPSHKKVCLLFKINVCLCVCVCVCVCVCLCVYVCLSVKLSV